MPVNPQFLAARDREQAHRLMAHLSLAPAVRLVWRRTRREFWLRMVPLTERARLELALAGSAFFCDQPVLLGDVFVLLWRLSPAFRRPLPGREGAVSGLGRKRFRFLRLWWALGSLRAAAAHRYLSAVVARCDLFAAETALLDWLAVAEQDAPGVDVAAARRTFSAARPQRCYPDMVTEFFAERYHLSRADILDAPVAVLHQIYRASVLTGPDGDMEVFAPSDRLLATPTP